MSQSILHSHNHTVENSGAEHQRAVKRTLFFDPKQTFFRPAGIIQCKCEECAREEAVQVQPKLTVNAPNDIYEKEADAMADRVMRMPDPQIQRQEEEEEERLQMKEQAPEMQRKCKACEVAEPLQWHTKPKQKEELSGIQRKCSHCEKEEKERLQRTPLAGSMTPFFQRKEAGGREVGPRAAASLHSNKGGGRALPENTRSWMESRFGADFSGVRIHTGSNAVQLSRDLNAKAFTHGGDIYFNRGAFSPGTSEGKRLLAHELTHTLQQTHGGQMPAVRGSSLQRSPVTCTMVDADTPLIPGAEEFLNNPRFREIRESLFEKKMIILSAGDSGPAVHLIQRLLLNTVCEGYNREVVKEEMGRKIYGEHTAHAVKIFQRTFADANGNLLKDDGIVGPNTLGSMDGMVGLEPIPPPLPAEGTDSCSGTPKDGPGLVVSINESTMTAWDLVNFDVAKSFVKVGHRNGLRSKGVVRTFQEHLDSFRGDDSVVFAIVGFASTTGNFSFNQKLSEQRADCVSQVLSEEGLKPLPGDIDIITGFGKVPAELKLGIKKISGKPITKKDIENREDRKVRIGIFFKKSKDDCPAEVKTHRSVRFIAKIACASKTTARINIADITASPPIYREFLWVQNAPGVSECHFFNQANRDDFQFVIPFAGLQLATEEPNNVMAPSDFAGRAALRSQDPGFAAREVLLNENLFAIRYPGVWHPDDCDVSLKNGRAPDIPGSLIPIGPVQCGPLPAPPEGGEECEIPEQEVECDRTAGATRFRAHMTRGSINILDRVPAHLKTLIQLIAGSITADATIGLIQMGTLDVEEGGQINRTLLFVGPDIREECGEAGIQPFSIGNEVDTSGKVFRLATRLPLIPTPFSDFWNLPAQLKIHPASNKDELTIGGGFGTFTFLGPKCDSGKGREISGRIFPLSPVFCGDIELPKIFDEETCEGDECPDSRKICASNRFIFRTGRMALEEIPLIGRQLAETYGCNVAAGYVNVGTRGLDPEIYREFFFVQQTSDCEFSVEQKTMDARSLLPMQLAIEKPDETMAPSDFTGASLLFSSSWWGIFPQTPMMLDLPGQWEKDCTSPGSMMGAFLPWPTGRVACGEVPTPPHTPKSASENPCNEFKKTNRGRVFGALGRLWSGEFMNILTNLKAPNLVLADTPLNRLEVGKSYDELAVGKNSEGQPVIAFLEFSVVNKFSDGKHLYVEVQLASPPCIFNSFGQRAYYIRRNCEEGLRGNITLRSLPELKDREKTRQPVFLT